MDIGLITSIKRALRSDNTPKSRRNQAKASGRATGFSENALEGLKDLNARMPPSDVTTEPAYQPAFHNTKRLGRDVTAGGGIVIDKDGTKRPHYWGHRQRLRTRFLNGGHDAMPEYELLELLLFNAIPRIDVKPLAKRLLSEFGDLNGVIAASKHRILKVDGSNEWVFYHLRVAEAFAHRMSQGRLRERDVVSSWDALIKYCRTVMAHRETEQFRVLYLDRKNILIADEAQAQGTVDHVPVYPREVVKRALELNSSAIIVVHNHPSGDPTPSLQDADMTRQLSVACDSVGVTIHDHVVIGKEDEFSFKQNGQL